METTIGARYSEMLSEYRDKVSNADTILTEARKKWFDDLGMTPEEIEKLFLETLRKIEYALYPFLDPENDEVA